MPAMSKIFSAGALVAALISSVAGHTAVEQIKIGEKTYQGFRGENAQTPETGADGPAWRTNQGWGWQPVKGDKINDPDIIAHIDATPSPNTAPATAGDKVEFTWHHTGECQEGEDGWDCSHHGWTTTYLASCNGDCANVDKTTLKFFKIDQEALVSFPEGTRFAEGEVEAQSGFWGTDEIFYKNGNKKTVTLPTDIPDGNYVLRTEVASVHNIDLGQGEIQFWPQAFNIKISGGSGTKVPDGVLGTEIYHTDDKLLNYKFYWHEEGAVTIPDAPGPKLASVAVASASKARRNHARDFSS